MKLLRLRHLVLGFLLAMMFHAGDPLRIGAVSVPKSTSICLDLQPQANQKLKDNFHSSDFAGNNLAELPRGNKKFAGVTFHIGDGLIQLASTIVKDKPDKVQGIAVGQAFARLHILHGTGYNVPEDTLIGKYIVHYQDKTRETIEIVYGKDVRDWWDGQDRKEVTRGKVAWKGSNAAVKQNNANIRLYLMTWKNPHPRNKVVSIDYLSTKTTAAAPFCVAMTVETK
jgi:hypothetical protein